MIDPHVSVLMLDAVALGAVDARTEDRVRGHLASCADCRREAQTAAELREWFEARVLPRGLRALDERRPHRSRRWLWLALPALAAAALLVGLWPRPEPRVLAIKGDAVLQVFAHRRGQTFAVHDGAELAAGDRLRFVVLPAGAAYLLVASVDGSGAAMIYYPYRGDHSAAIDGDRVEPTGSIELDAAPGPERVFALLSDQPLDASMVIARLSALAARGAQAIREDRPLDVPVRAQPSLVFEKAQP